MSTVQNPVRSASAHRPGVAQRVGMVVAGLLCLTSLPSAFGSPTPEGEVGPPTVVLVAGTVLAVVGLGALVVAWRSGHPVALRVLAACVVVLALSSAPGLFVPIPPLLKAAVAAQAVITVAAVVLLFRGGSRAGGQP